jgi:hypothetical protein
MPLAAPTLLDQPERRFPLDLGTRIPRIRDLFKAATKNQWDPVTDVEWDKLHPEHYSEEQRAAARLFWSRRAWGEYGAVSESPALLIRFCHDRSEPDLRYYFTIRTQEESRHAEISYELAERLGGYIPQPVKTEFQQAVATHGVRKMALDPETPVEAIIAGLVCGLEEFAFDWFKIMVGSTSNPVANRALRLILRDEVRHCAFGWHFLEHRIPQMSGDQIDVVARAMINTIEHVELTGYRVPWLAPDSEAARIEGDSDRICWAAGLGATVEEIEKPVFVATMQRIRSRMGSMGVHLPMFHHAHIGEL